MAYDKRSRPGPARFSQFGSPEQAIAAILRERGFDDAVKPALTEVINAMEGPTMLLAFCQAPSLVPTGSTKASCGRYESRIIPQSSS